MEEEREIEKGRGIERKWKWRGKHSQIEDSMA